MNLAPDALILGVADDLLAEHRAKMGDHLDLESLEGRLAKVLSDLVRIVREDQETSQ